MKRIFTLVILFMGFQMIAQEWQTPKIEGYGKIKYFENAAEQPDASIHHKLVFNITDEKEKEGVNAGLWRIARTLNLFEAAKMPSEKLEVVAVVHGEATYLALSEAMYQKKYNKPNPNLELLKLLKANGVKVYVCGQALSGRDFEPKDMNEYTQLALSALTVLSNYQHKGYALIQ